MTLLEKMVQFKKKKKINWLQQTPICARHVQRARSLVQPSHARLADGHWEPSLRDRGAAGCPRLYKRRTRSDVCVCALIRSMVRICADDHHRAHTSRGLVESI